MKKKEQELPCLIYYLLGSPFMPCRPLADGRVELLPVVWEPEPEQPFNPLRHTLTYASVRAHFIQARLARRPS